MLPPGFHLVAKRADDGQIGGTGVPTHRPPHVARDARLGRAGILLLAASLVLVPAVVIRACLVPVGFSSLLLATALLLPLLGRIRTLANHLPSPRHVNPFADSLAQTRRSRCDSVECGQRLVGPLAG